jgi:hypothetical protein
MLGVLVGDRELSKVRSNHVELNFNRHVFLSVVDTSCRSNHRRNNDTVSQSGLDDLWLLTRAKSELGFVESVEELEVWTLVSLRSS